MGEQENIAIVQQCYDAFTKGDVQRLLTYMDEGIDWEVPEVQGVPFSGRRQGRSQVEEFFRMEGEAQDPRQFETREFIANGDRVIVLGSYAWHIKANGEEFTSDYVHVFTMRDGKVAGFREFMDSHKAAVAYQCQPGFQTAAASAQAGQGILQ